MGDAMKVELLAPVGSMEAFHAAVQNGADAVYLAGKSFGARAYADNFTNTEINEMIEYAHVRNVRVYVTVNTLLFDEEFKAVMDYVDFLYEHDCDAIIVQDLGVLREIHARYPDFELHASTQMNVHNVGQARMLKKFGISRIVMAREANLDQITAIQRETGLEIEIFVHGALCQSYSGNCLMSSIIGKRSGNRGKCAQPCRLPYRLESNEGIEEINYPLSMKDLMTVEEIDRILAHPVTSLKIEGRMKRSEYVGLVTATYREAIDKYYAGENTDVSFETIKNLKKMFNRGFTKGYVLKETFSSVVNDKRPNHMGIPIGKVVESSRGLIKIHLTDDLRVGDGIRFIDEKDVGMNVQSMTKHGQKVVDATSGDIITLSFDQEVSTNAEVVKTTDSLLISKWMVDSKKEIKKIPVHASFHAQIGRIPELSIVDERGNKVLIRGTTECQKSNHPDWNENRYGEQLRKTGGTPFSIDDLNIDIEEQTFLPVREINEMRRIALEELTEKRKKRHHRIGRNAQHHSQVVVESKQYGLTASVKTLEQLEAVKASGIETIYFSDVDQIEEARKIYPDVVLLLPRVAFDEIIPSKGQHVVIGELSGLENHPKQKLVSDVYFNIVNSRAVEFLHEQHVSRVMLSPEISYQQMKELIFSYHQRNNSFPNLEVMVYGYYELMIMKHCVIASQKGFNKIHCGECYKKQYFLTDRLGYRFPLQQGHNCTLTMLNARRLSLLDQLDQLSSIGIHNYRLSFTIEPVEEIRFVIHAFQKKLRKEPSILDFPDLTFGHFKQRIE